MALLRRTTQLVEEFTCGGHIQWVIDDDPDRTVPRGMNDLLVTEDHVFALSRYTVIHSTAQYAEWNVVDLEETLSGLDAPECLRTGWRVTLLILLQVEQQLHVLLGTGLSHGRVDLLLLVTLLDIAI